VDLEACQQWLEHAGRWAGSDAARDLLDGLRLIERGTYLRRRLDESSAHGSSAREKVEAALDRLKASAGALLDADDPAAIDRATLSALIEVHLRTDQAYLSRLSTRDDLDAGRRLRLLDRFRIDLHWLSSLIDHLEGESAPRLGVIARLDLERIESALATPVATPLEPQRLALHERCERLRQLLLGRQVRRESLAVPAPEATPDQLWTRRLQLGHLLAEVESAAGAPAAVESSWTDRLAAHREALTTAARDRLDALPAGPNRQAWRAIVVATQGEIHEVTTLVEDLAPDRGAQVLSRTLEDLERLVDAARRDAADDARRPKAERVGPVARKLDRMRRGVRNDLQEKRLAARMEGIFGRRAVAALEALILLLIIAVTAMIATESALERAGRLSESTAQTLAWVDLAICSVFLAEFALRWSLVQGKWLYLRRHFLVDVLASFPFAFFAHGLTWMLRAEDVQLLRLARFARISQMARYIRLAQPAIRLARLAAFTLRFSDRLVRRNAGLLNRRVIFFEAHGAHDPESRHRHLLVGLRRRFEERAAEIWRGLDEAGRLRVIDQATSDLEGRLERLPPAAVPTVGEAPVGRAIPVEAVVARLIEMTPERLVSTLGTDFAESVDRYLGLLDLPLIRRLPLVRDLVAPRAQGPAETAALAANTLGHAILRGLNAVYFVADLRATVSPPQFLDRLGTAIVAASKRPAKRLLILGAAFLLMFGALQAGQLPDALRTLAGKLQALLGWPVVILGSVCLVAWMIGGWLKRVANQAAETSGRVVEAQFASQTKLLRRQRRDLDARFLTDRVIAPEMRLRSSDDRPEDLEPAPAAGPAAADLFDDPELIFLRKLNLLHRDYLDGAPFHANDTKANAQLVGNLALQNLRRSRLAGRAAEQKRLDRLDITRAGAGVLGGPHLWFHYITRMIAQETAALVVDYNHYAVPRERLASAPRAMRESFRAWLARRLAIPADAVELPAPVGALADAELPTTTRTRPEAADFLETVEFTAVDFLTDDPAREGELRSRFGDQVAELIRRDRRRVIRKAFRSEPLHLRPLAQRTINPYVLYETYFAKGRVLALPIVLAWRGVNGAGHAVRWVGRTVRAILNPGVGGDEGTDSTYAAALRKIHRMRKPAFMEALWMRARFDAEYLGLSLPGVPDALGGDGLLDGDLGFIGATRQDRLAADRLRRDQRDRLARIGDRLARMGWTMPALADELARDYPHLASRGGEAVRALVAASLADHDDVDTLGLSIEGIERMVAHAADPASNLRRLPEGLPPRLVGRRLLWNFTTGRGRPLADLLDLPGPWRDADPATRRRILRYLRRHRSTLNGWAKVVLGQGGPDPRATLRSRLREVLVRTDLWSDQIVILRTVQALTMLDVHHYADLVYALGGYDEGEAPDPPPRLPLRERVGDDPGHGSLIGGEVEAPELIAGPS